MILIHFFLCFLQSPFSYSRVKGIGFPGVVSELVGVIRHETRFTIKTKCSL